MIVNWLSCLRSPCCVEELTSDSETASKELPYNGMLSCSCGRTFPIKDNIANFLYPVPLKSSDNEWKCKYDQGADKYDVGNEWLFRTFGEDEGNLRADIIKLLELAPRTRVLDLGCGTGRDLALILEDLGPHAALFAMDISVKMLEHARRNVESAKTPIEFLLANGSYLPFDDNMFDAVFHFGGVNTFDDKARAFAEMTRVTRVGGKIVVGDEGIAPWLRRKKYGRILINANPLYRHQPPLSALPVNALEPRVQWILGNAFYVIDFRVGEEPPHFDIDIPIPGKGDTLRSRYEKRGT